MSEDAFDIVEDELPFDDEDGPLKEAHGEFIDEPGEESNAVA